MKIKAHISFVLLFFSGCSLFFQTVYIEVPNGYVGWVYVIPTKDTSGLHIKIVDGKFQINENGIAYVPVSLLNLKEDSRVLVFENATDISTSMRYAGNVIKTENKKENYEFIQFYLPSKDERKISNGAEYWRDKRWEYTGGFKSKLDSLLELEKVVFK